MPSPFSFNSGEIALLTDAQFFRQKAKVSEKIRGQLVGVHGALQDELRRADLIVPASLDPGRHQFVKGEHLEDCPYQYLDCPKHFVGDEKCTFRTLFWWGHHVVCAWIVEGALLKRYKKNLVDRFHQLAGRDLELSTAPSPWEWKRGEGYTLPLRHDRKAQVAAVMAERAHLKIGRYFPLDDDRVRAGDLAGAAREAFQSLLPLMSP